MWDVRPLIISIVVIQNETKMYVVRGVGLSEGKGEIGFFGSPGCFSFFPSSYVPFAKNRLFILEQGVQGFYS